MSVMVSEILDLHFLTNCKHTTSRFSFREPICIRIHHLKRSHALVEANHKILFAQPCPGCPKKQKASDDWIISILVVGAEGFLR